MLMLTSILISTKAGSLLTQLQGTRQHRHLIGSVRCADWGAGSTVQDFYVLEFFGIWVYTWDREVATKSKTSFKARRDKFGAVPN